MFETKTSNLDNLSRGPGSESTIEQKGRGNQTEPLNKYKRVISGVKNREIWTAQAEILIRQVTVGTACLKISTCESSTVDK